MRFSLVLVALLALLPTALGSHSYHAWAKKYYTAQRKSQGSLRDKYYKLWQGAKKKAAASSAAHKTQMAAYTKSKKASDSALSDAATKLKAANDFKKQASTYSGLEKKYKALYDAAVAAEKTNRALATKYKNEAAKHAAAAASNLKKSNAAKASAKRQSGIATSESAKAAKLSKAGKSYENQAKAAKARAAAARAKAAPNKKLADQYYKIYVVHKKKRDLAYAALHHNGVAYQAWKQHGIYLAHATFNKKMYQYKRQKKYLTAYKKYEKLYKAQLAKYNKHWAKHTAARKKVKPENVFSLPEYPELGAIDAETDDIEDSEDF